MRIILERPFTQLLYSEFCGLPTLGCAVLNPLTDQLLTPLQALSHAAYFVLPALAVLVLLIIGGTARTRAILWPGLFALLVINIPRVLVNAGGAADGPYIGPQFHGGSDLLLSGVWPPAPWGFVTQAAHAGWLLVVVGFFSRRAAWCGAAASLAMLGAAAWGQPRVDGALLLAFLIGAVIAAFAVRLSGTFRRLPDRRWAGRNASGQILKSDWRLMSLLLLAWFGILVCQNYFAKYALSSPECYQWYFSRKLEWGYFSKPPMTAWINWLVTMLAADTQWAVRLAASIEALAIVIVVFDFVRRMTGQILPAFWASAALLSMPFFFLANGLSQDPNNVMATFWMLAVYAYFRAWKSGGVYWIYTGLAVGACILTKYTGLLLIVAGAAHYLMYARGSARRDGAIWALTTATLVVLPNVLWLWSLDWVTVLHTSQLSMPGGTVMSRYTDWFLAQILPVSPLMLFLLLTIAIRATFRLRRAPLLAIPWLSWAILYGFYMAVAFNRNTLPHWILPAFVGLPILLGACVANSRRPRRLIGVVILACLPGLALVGLVLQPNQMAKFLTQEETGTAKLFNVGTIELDFLPFFTAPFAVAPRIGAYLKADPKLFLMGAQQPALYTFFTADQPPVYRIPTGIIASQFEIWDGLEDHEGDDALFVARGTATDTAPIVEYLLEYDHFDKATLLEEIPEIVATPQRIRFFGYTLYRMENFHYHAPTHGAGGHIPVSGISWTDPRLFPLD